jgi:hypothetical protein
MHARVAAATRHAFVCARFGYKGTEKGARSAAYSTVYPVPCARPRSRAAVDSRPPFSPRFFLCLVRKQIPRNQVSLDRGILRRGARSGTGYGLHEAAPRAGAGLEVVSAYQLDITAVF